MGNLSSSIGIQDRYTKARQFARSPVLFASIQLGKNVQGFILNASEGGVCVQTAKEILGDEPLDLRFQSVRPGAWVHARGRIVWKNESNTVAGLQFIDADKEIAGEVRNWLNFGESLQELRGDWWPDSQPANPFVASAASMANTTPITMPSPAPAPIEMLSPSAATSLPGYDSVETNEAPPLAELGSVTAPEANSPAPEAPAPVVIGFPPRDTRDQRHSYEYVRPSAGEERKGKFAIVGGAGAACVLLFTGWFVFGHKSQPPMGANAIVPAQAPSSSQPNARASALKPITPAAATEPVASASSAASATALPMPTAASGLVLQVAAMSEQANAEKLANSLKSGHFPAFVSKRDDDRFYRVLVGPFPNETPLRETGEALKKSGYDSIEKHWTP